MRHGFALLCVLLLGASAAAAGEPLRPLDDVFKGRITALDKDHVVIRYDFDDPVEMQDWVVTKPFRVAGKLQAAYENKAVRIEGTGAIMHCAAFDGEVSIEYDLDPWKERDLGVIVTEVSQSNQFVLFSVNDLYFQKWDGADQPGHMITRFGVDDASLSAGWINFRYIARGRLPEIHKFQKIHVKAEKKGTDDSLTIGDKTYSGVEMGRPMLDLKAGIYAVDSSAVVDTIVVSGKLSPRWLASQHAELRLARPLGDTSHADADAKAKRKLDVFAAGGIAAQDVLVVVSDTEASAEVRTAAAKAVETSGDKSVVPHLVPLLYSPDLLTRTLTDEMVRKLVGRSFGYQPKASEEKRSASIQKLVHYIQKNAAEFGAAR